MTVISDHIANIAGADDSTAFVFSSPNIRDSSDSTALVTTLVTAQMTADGGVLTTPDLDPGACTVRVGLQSYGITIPDSGTPIRLWPLIEAGMPIPPAQEATAVRNGGGVARAQRITESAYLALTTPDPETLYVVVED